MITSFSYCHFVSNANYHPLFKSKKVVPVIKSGKPASRVEDVKDSSGRTKEEKKLAVMAMSKKNRRLYERIMHSRKQKRAQVYYF